MSADRDSEELSRRVIKRLVSPPDADETLLVGAPGLARAVAVSVTDGVASLQVRLPTPTAELRARIEREFRESVQEVTGLQTVAINWAVDVPDSTTRVDFLPEVKHVIAVGSGKGGVGKSTVATNLAVALAEGGASVGLLDADIYGPNAPTLLGLSSRTPDTSLEDAIKPRLSHGIKVMSIDFISGEDDPVIWRGPLVDDALKQLLDDVDWGSLDYLVIDLPPGTGDAHVTVTQYLPLSGAVVVTTPHSVAAGDSERTIRALDRYEIPVLGVVENMSWFDCPDCGSTTDIFGTGGADVLRDRWDVPVLGRLPLDQRVSTREVEETESGPPGIDLPVIGRLQLPRTRTERERADGSDPVALRERAFRDRFELIALRTATRVSSLATADS